MSGEVNWERLDKTRFFTVGVGLFSGITTVLYPLSVVKTRQMAAEGVSGGLSGTKAVASTIWKQDGLRGFYRGFGTVVFGTIPARVVYLTTLEVTKSTVNKVGEQLNLAPATLAGASSFIAGGCASLSTQAVVVPIDVVSQRLMMQGAQVAHGISSASKQAPAAAAAAASHNGRSSGTSTTSSSTASTSTNSISGTGQAGTPPSQPGQQPGQRRAFATTTASTSTYYSSSSSQAAHGLPSSSGGNSATPSTAAAATTPGRVSAARCQSHHTSTHPLHHPTAAAAARPLPSALPPQRSVARAAVGASSWRHLSTAAAAGPSNGWQMARHIVTEEGVRGLYRGFLPSVATFVPSSAVWWGAYGFWQKLIWMRLVGDGSEQSTHQQQGERSSSPNSSSSSSSSTGRVVVVQVASSLLAGCTSALATNPLDLIKTRLQVAEVSGGGPPPSWRAVASTLLAEEGALGLWRGVVPRMASSAMWGTAMVSAYEFLKRLCALPPP